MTEAEELAEFNRIRDQFVDSLALATSHEIDQRYYVERLKKGKPIDPKFKEEIRQQETELKELKENTDSLIRYMHDHLSDY